MCCCTNKIAFNLRLLFRIVVTWLLKYDQIILVTRRIVTKMILCALEAHLLTYLLNTYMYVQ